MNKDKSLGVTILLAVLITGLGHVYVGRAGRGAMFLLGAIVGTLFFVIPGIVIFIYNIFDAYQLAIKYNETQKFGTGTDR